MLRMKGSVVSTQKSNYQVVKECIFDQEKVVFSVRKDSSPRDLDKYMVFLSKSGNVEDAWVFKRHPDAIRKYDALLADCRARQSTTQYAGAAHLRVGEYYMFTATINGNEVKQYGRVIGGDRSDWIVRFIGEGRIEVSNHWVLRTALFTIYHIADQSVVKNLMVKEEAELLLDQPESSRLNRLWSAITVSLIMLGLWLGSLFSKEEIDDETFHER